MPIGARACPGMFTSGTAEFSLAIGESARFLDLLTMRGDNPIVLRNVSLIALGAVALLGVDFPDSRGLDAQQPKPSSKILYVLPNYGLYLVGSAAQFSNEVASLRQRFSEGKYVRVGFTTYINVSMGNWSVNTSDPAQVREALTSTISQIDTAIARARANNIPVCFSILTAIRDTTDPVQIDAERADRRNVEWYMDNGMAPGWVTQSRYARRFRGVFEAYVREIGSVLANRMAKYPATLVAASGDGEVELSYIRTHLYDPAHYTEATSQLADYSPFAVAEFRDWLRNAGLYAPAQPYAGQGYDGAARYQGDASPAADTNGDGHTLNGDFGTSFTSWDLRYFDWSLDDRVDPDPNAIPSSVYDSGRFDQNPDAGAARFDAPRVRQPGNAWWETWNLFRAVLVWHYNQDVARWMTTTVDPESGRTLPVTRWFSHQIPADYIFSHSPEFPDYRLVSSASPYWTADITPYGGLGITSFNVNVGGGLYAVTARNVVPEIIARGVRWAIMEWNPSIPVSNSLEIYDQEMAMIEHYRPTLIVPFAWGDPFYQIQNTPFEIALRNMIDRIKNTPPTSASSVEAPKPLFLKPGDPGVPSRFYGLGWKTPDE